MTLPTYKFEIAFNAGVTTPSASRTWTDVTAYVLLDDGVDITYGRGDWRSEADANTLRLTLNNSDGRFTAGRAASPYYPNVKLGRPIRVTATVGGVSSVRFVGFIDEWPLEWPAAVTTFATAQITATSRSAWLSEGLELRSIVEEEILVDSPLEYYTLGESAGATRAGESSGNGVVPLSMTGSGAAIVFGTAIGPSTDGLTAALFPSSSNKILSGQRSASPSQFTIEAFFSTTSAAPAGTTGNIFSYGPAGIVMDELGRLLATASGASFLGSGALNDGLTHHAALSFDGTTHRLYVDGSLIASNTITAPIWSNNLTTLIGASTFTETLAHVAICGTALSATRIAAHASAGLTGFTGETPAARITRYASYADIAATELSLDTGQVPALTHLDTTGSTALDMMRKIEATEEGILFDRADGLLGFHDRAHRYSAPSAFVLDVTQGQVSTGMEPRLDRTTVRNDVTATSTDGTVTAHVTNTSSISTYGPARESLELATSNADEPFEHASWLVNQYNDAQPRVPQLTVDVNNLTTALSQSVLAAGVSTQFTVTNLPTQAAVSSQDYIVEGYSESIGEARHSIAFNISQATPYDVWTVEDSTFGAYDSNPLAL